jgi:4-alpha-glucanotransferase
MTTDRMSRQLRALARMHGIQTSYFNVQHARVAVADGTLRELLAAMGMSVNSPEDLEAARHDTVLRLWQRAIEPVIVAWDGLMPRFEVRTEAGETLSPHVEIVREDGTTRTFDPGDLHVDDASEAHIEGVDYRRLLINTGERLPAGYHTLRVVLGSRQSEAIILAAPRTCYRGIQQWGAFAPLYSLRGRSDWGAGSYADLEELAEWTARRGGGFVGTLPLLPCFCEEGETPSPYLPVTRLLWNDFFIDIESIPFLHDCAEAVSLLADRDFASRRRALGNSTLTDYAGVQRLKADVLRILCRYVFAHSPGQRADLEDFLREHPLVSDYARFRATCSHEKRPWSEWREPACEGSIAEAQSGEGDQSYHEFVQWLAHRQITRCLSSASEQRAGLYLDLPLGVHPHGYDTWRFREDFTPRVSCGAPPDVVFTTGQNWGAPPLNPEAIREHHYDYLRACIEHHMRNAALLRIDHVMGLHHIFCIPEGADASVGTYVRYHPEEVYAILSLESHRHRTAVIGEDLGTVPTEVRRSMSRHGLSRMFVVYYEMDAIASGSRPRIPRDSMASINTHDMPPFASMWSGLDICQQAELGIVQRVQTQANCARRETSKQILLQTMKSSCGTLEGDAGARKVLRCILGWMGRSRARYVMVSLDDLWLEKRQQNVPGVGARYPSWRTRAAFGMEEIEGDDEVAESLGEVASARAGTRSAQS